MTTPLTGPSLLKDIVDPQFHQNNLLAEAFIKAQLGIKLDKGKSIIAAREATDLPAQMIRFADWH